MSVFSAAWIKIVRERIGFLFERTQIPCKHVAFGTYYNKQSGFVFVYILTQCTRAHSVGAKMTAIMAQKCCKLGDNIFLTHTYTHAVRKCWLGWRVGLCIVVVVCCFLPECGKRESHAGTKRPLKAGLKTHSFVAAGAHIKILVGLRESPFLGV